MEILFRPSSFVHRPSFRALREVYPRTQAFFLGLSAFDFEDLFFSPFRAFSFLTADLLYPLAFFQNKALLFSLDLI
jgi:hypothetical protein